ncbi:MAG: cysteine desulfurase NifS [Oscillospiraceae bacterium]
MEKFVYADNAATTRVSQRVLKAMLPYFTEKYGNASSWFYPLGQQSALALETARERVATALGADTNEIFFTSCGSESDNWAIRGVAEKLGKIGKKHIITAVFEHHAVLHACQYLEENGYDVTYLPITQDGFVRPDDVRRAIRSDTALVSVMYANNEIGTIQPISEISKICHENNVLFHTDAVQAVGHLEINVKSEGIDLLSLSGHKINAQKGVGALFVRKGIDLGNFIFGGAQERDRRGGTENIPAIVGLGEAIVAANDGLGEKIQRVTAMRNRLINGILQLPHTRLNGDKNSRLSGNANLSIEGVEGEALLLKLSFKGICVSSGSACASKSLEPSHVILALGVPHEIAHCSLRFSISEENTDEEIDYILQELPPIVEELRKMSPLWEKIVGENVHE